MKTQKKLYRSTENYIIAGVCGGLGDYFNIDPVLVRLVFVLLTIGNGVGVAIYIIMMIIVPKDGADYKDSVREKNAKEFVGDIKTGAKSFANQIKKNSFFKNNKALIASLIILLGFITFFEQIFPMYWFKWNLFWPLLIIFIGFYILFKKED